MASKTIYDLTAGSVFKVIFISALGAGIVFSLLAVGAFWIFPYLEPNGSRHLDVGTLFSKGLYVLLDILVFCLWMLVGRWIWAKIQPNALDVEIEFLSEKNSYSSLSPQSVYRLTVFCGKGVMVVFAGFFTVFLIIGLLASNFFDLPIAIGFGLIYALFMVIFPYIWAYFLMYASYVSRPITRKLNVGAIRFAGAVGPEKAEESTSG